MRTMEVFDVGDKVLIEVEVLGAKFEKDGKVNYFLKNPQTGNKFDYMFAESEIKGVLNNEVSASKKKETSKKSANENKGND